MENIFDTIYQILQSFQEYFLVKQEREMVKGKLRENLAKNNSLRRKDFDNMMEGILSTLDRKEEELIYLSNNYLSNQKKTWQALGENLTNMKGTLAHEEEEEEEEEGRIFQGMVKDIFFNQSENGGKEVTHKLKEFQKEHQKMIDSLKALLVKREEVRLRDFKSTVENIRRNI